MSARYVVTGPVVVMRPVGGGSQYLYRGALLTAASYEPDAVEHVLALGLIAPIVDEPDLEAETAPAEPLEAPVAAGEAETAPKAARARAAKK